MSTASQTMLNQSVFEEQDVSSQLGFFSFPSNFSTSPFGCSQPLKSVAAFPASLALDAQTTLSESPTLKQKEDAITSHFGESQLLSLQRSSASLW